MKRILILAVAVVLVLSALAGCGGEPEDEVPPSAQGEDSESKLTVVDAYLAVIDDIYQEDSALNEDISIMVIDPTDSILNEEETAALCAALEETYALTILEKTYEQLEEEGYLEEGLYFKEGILISVTEPELDSKGKIFTCGVRKWRSGLGAIGSNDVAAVFDGGEWTVTKEELYIS